MDVKDVRVSFMHKDCLKYQITADGNSNILKSTWSQLIG